MNTSNYITTIILFAVASIMLISQASASNDTIKVEYFNLQKTSETSDITDIIEFLGVDFRKIVITGNIKDKQIITTTHIVKDGIHSVERISPTHYSLTKDTLIITIKTLPIDTNKVKTEVKLDLGIAREMLPFTYDIGTNKHCSLVEIADGAELEYVSISRSEFYKTTSTTFPLIAYSTGMPLAGGILHTCALKNSDTHPKH